MKRYLVILCIAALWTATLAQDMRRRPIVVPSGGTITITTTNRVGVSESAGVVTKTAVDGWGNAGYSSVESITGDGWIEWTVTETNTDRMVGLSQSDPNQAIASEEFSWYQAAGSGTESLTIYESGGTGFGNFGPYVANTTVLRIERVGSTITYYKDGVSKRAVTGATTNPLIVDVTMYTNGATVGPITMNQ